jgi:hypothetical protein
MWRGEEATLGATAGAIHILAAASRYLRQPVSAPKTQHFPARQRKERVEFILI